MSFAIVYVAVEIHHQRRLRYVAEAARAVETAERERADQAAARAQEAAVRAEAEKKRADREAVQAGIDAAHAEAEAKRADATAARERANAEEAARQRQAAETAGHLAETRQCQFLYQLANVELEARRFDVAKERLQQVPASQVSWETRRLLYDASLVPEKSMRLADGQWGILAAAWNPGESGAVSPIAAGGSLYGTLPADGSCGP